MNKDQITKAVSRLNSAIDKIDLLLQKYSFVTRMELAQQARLELEFASRVLNRELQLNGSNENSTLDSTGNDGEESDKLD